jgi:hypothetical protein
MLGSLRKFTMGMGMHIFIKKMKKVNLKNQMKTIILEKWLTMIPNSRHCGYPPITHLIQV